jgi:hypothetical protein
MKIFDIIWVVRNIFRFSIFDSVKPMLSITAWTNLYLLKQGSIIRFGRIIFILWLVWFDGKIVARSSVALCNHVVQLNFPSLEVWLWLELVVLNFSMMLSLLIEVVCSVYLFDEIESVVEAFLFWFFDFFW